MRSRARAATAALVVALTTALAGAALADTATPTPTESSLTAIGDVAKVQPYAQPGIVFVTIDWTAWLKDNRYSDYFNDAQPIELTSTCTGYVVNPAGWIATAGHCVSFTEIQKDYLDIAVALARQERYYDTNDPEIIRATLFDHLKTESSDATGATGKPDREVSVWWGADVSGIETEKGKPARVVAFQELEKGDAALLKVDEPDMNALILVPGDETVDTLTPIAAIGFPGSVDDVTDNDYNPSIKTGTVSSKKTIGGGLLPVYEINADVSPGMSGGPTVDYQGRVIGTNSFFPVGENQAFNFVGTSQRVLELMASSGVTNEQSEDTQTYLEGIDAYFAGDKETAVARLQEVSEAQPANEMVQTYLQRAEDLPDVAAAEEDGLSTWVWILIALIVLLVLVAIAAVVVLLIVRGRSRPQGGEVHPAAPSDNVPTILAPEAPVAETPTTERATQVIPPSTESTPHYCSSCGAAATPGQRFCSNCGRDLAPGTHPSGGS